MIHNFKHKEVLTASLFRQVGWAGLIAMLALSLLCPPLVRESAGQEKVPPRTPQKKQVEVEKQIGVEKNTDKIFQPGSLKGRIFDYRRTNKSLMIRQDCLCFTKKDSVKLVDSNGKTVAQGVINVMEKSDGAMGGPFCTFDVKDVPPGTYRLEFYLTDGAYMSGYNPVTQPCWTIVNYSSASHPATINCNDPGAPCDNNPDKTVTIQPGKVA
jgi:hypothetical protein